MNKVNNEQKNDVKKIKPRVNGETRRKKIVTTIIVVILLLAMLIPSIIGIVDVLRG